MKTEVDWEKAWKALEWKFKALQRRERASEKKGCPFYLFVWEILEMTTEIRKQCTKNIGGTP